MPSFAEAKVWGILATENAKALLNAAELLADHGYRGPAISLAVLAVEEATKARVMFGYARSEHRAGFGLSDSTMKKLLRGHHELRHAIAWLQGSSEEVIEHLASPMPDPERADRLASELAALDWLLVANTSKNGGFYVDHIGAGHWTTPQAATEAQWAMAKAVATPFVAEAGTQGARWRADPATGSEQPKAEPPDFPNKSKDGGRVRNKVVSRLLGRLGVRLRLWR